MHIWIYEIIRLITPIFVLQFIIMVIDSTDRERLAVTREELFELLQHEDLSKACLLVYANKQVSANNMGGFVTKIIHKLISSILYEGFERGDVSS